MKLRFRVGVRAAVLCLAPALWGALMCGPAAAQDTSDYPSPQQIIARGSIPGAAASDDAASVETEAGSKLAPAADSGAAVVPGPFLIASAAPIAFAPVAFPGASSSRQPAINYALPNGADRCDILTKSGLVACLSNIAHDQPHIWTAPIHLHQRDALWLLPIAAAASLAFANDHQAEAAVNSEPFTVRKGGNLYSDLGSDYTLSSVSIGIYAIGRIIHNERVRETGMVSLEALADAGIVSETIKFATNRIRPGDGPASGQFWADGPRTLAGAETEIYTTNGSFPSGHTTAMWAVTHVLVEETPGHLWLHVGLYALAGGVGVARVLGRDHYPSDVVIGAPLGYLLGGYVYRRRSQFYQKGPLKTVSFSPLYNSATRTYGMAVSFVP